METIFLEMNYLGEYSQRELDTYRNIGSVKYLRHLRRQEVRRRKLYRRIKWALNSVFFGACTLLSVWLFASWVDIVTHNLDPNPVYQVWNFFTMFS